MNKFITKLKNKLLSFKTHRLDTSPMWFLACSEKELEERVGVDQEVLEVLLGLRRDGFAILKKNIPDHTCDELISDFKRYCATNPISKTYSDEYGLHSRLALFHYVSDFAMDVALAPRTVKVIRKAFDNDFNIVGSLFFEKGSSQDIHRDTPAFFTNPLNHFFGVWNALEDIHADSGELRYYPGGHLVARDEKLYSDPQVTIENYFMIVEEECKARGLNLEKYCPSKGDTLIWLPELPHGGSPRNNPALSRKSIVFHYLPQGIPIHGARDFFNKEKPIFIKENYSIKMRGDTRCIDMGDVRFYHNHKEGNFEED